MDLFLRFSTYASILMKYIRIDGQLIASIMMKLYWSRHI